MKKKNLWIIFFLLLVHLFNAYGIASAQDKMEWWRDDKFGMFIHWGIYSVLGLGEWVMIAEDIPVAEYELLADQFNPTQFDANSWVTLAKQAGMKYLVITSKHHDGFCMWDTDLTDYDVVDSTPFGRDVIAEMAQACQDQDIVFGVYYSINDWHYPDPASHQYRDNYLFPQITELIQNYPVSILWFDGDWQYGWTDQDATDLYNLCLSLNPEIIVNDRVKRDMPNAGDYITPEQEIPDEPPARDWESCMTINSSWGFNKYDHNWKTSKKIIRTLLEISSKGGNFLLNVGPTSEGVIPQPSVDVLLEMGEWLDVYGETVYGTRTSPIQTDVFGRVTYRNDMFYPHVWLVNPSRIISLPYTVEGECAVELFSDCSSVPFTVYSSSVSVDLNGIALQPIATTLRFQPLNFVTPQPEGHYLLTTDKVHLQGEGLCIEAPGHVGCWTESDEYVFWRLKVEQTGPFEVILDYAVDPCCAGHNLAVRLGDQELSHTSQTTGGWQNYAPFSLGEIDLETGWSDLIVTPTGADGANINLLSITLHPILDAPHFSMMTMTQDHKVQLTWEAIQGANGYHVYRDTAPEFMPDQSGGANRAASMVNDQDGGVSGVQWTDPDDVAGDPAINYYYLVTAVGSRESIPSNRCGVFDFELITTENTDFNHVAFPLEIQNVNDAAALMSFIPECNSVAYWDANQQGYAQYVPELPTSNFSVLEDHPFYVNIQSAAYLTLLGEYTEPIYALVTTATTNFNEIMLPLDQSEITTASQLLNDIPNCNSVARWDATTQGVEQFVHSLPAFDFNVRAGYPYLVHVTKGGDWPSGGAPKNQLSITEIRDCSDAPHLVWGRIQKSVDPTPAHQISFNTFIVGREGDVLTDKSPGCSIQDDVWRVQCSTFQSAWKAGERLIIQFINSENVLLEEIEITLSYNSDDQAGKVNLDEMGLLPSKFYLGQNYPNPFNPSTMIDVVVPKSSHVRVVVYNIQGQLVRILMDEDMVTGSHQIFWDGHDDMGHALGSSVYVIQMEGINFIQKRKALYIK